MAGAPPPIQIGEGILRTRDLVELYYQGRMVVTLKESFFAITASTQTSIIQQDPRRIRYEIAIFRASGSPGDLAIGTPAAVASNQALALAAPNTTTLVLVRDWRSDLEAVCLAQDTLALTDSIFVSVRETILTPLPVDEEP